MATQRRARDRHALITGATSGIGAGLARKFHAQGATVNPVARSHDAELGSRTTTVPIALSDPDACGGLFERLVEVKGCLDVPINNAGIAWGLPSRPILTAHGASCWVSIWWHRSARPSRVAVAPSGGKHG